MDDTIKFGLSEHMDGQQEVLLSAKYDDLCFGKGKERENGKIRC